MPPLKYQQLFFHLGSNSAPCRCAINCRNMRNIYDFDIKEDCENSIFLPPQQ